MRRTAKREEGGVFPTFLAAVTAVVVITGILLQVGNGGSLRSQAQTAADASALAAVAEIQLRVISLLQVDIEPYGAGWGPGTAAAAETYAENNRATASSVTEEGYLGRAVKVTVKGNDRLGSPGPLKRFANRRADADAIAAIDIPVCARPTPTSLLVCTGHDMGPMVVRGQPLSVLRKLTYIHLVGDVPDLFFGRTDGLAVDPGGALPGNVASEANRELGREMAAARGWTGVQFDCLDWVYQHESGWNQYADNPSSSAYGIPQALPGSKMSSAGPDYLTNPRTQIAWGLDYIAGRYGTPCSAKAFWQSHNWY